MTLLERDDSLAVLARALALARTTGQLVSVSGEAGIGKSSLLRTFSAREAAAIRMARWPAPDRPRRSLPPSRRTGCPR